MSNCPTSLSLSQLTDTDEFKNILSGEVLDGGRANSFRAITYESFNHFFSSN